MKDKLEREPLLEAQAGLHPDETEPVPTPPITAGVDDINDVVKGFKVP